VTFGLDNSGARSINHRKTPTYIVAMMFFNMSLLPPSPKQPTVYG